jgi:TATA-box binding protein (TBP) (component of TFIID and TFIIIB)
MTKVSIVNVVAAAALGRRVDLDELGKCPKILHDPDVYGGRVAYYRSPEFAGEVTVFASGKMISVEGRSETEAFRALKLAKEYLIQNGFVGQVNLGKKVQNIVAVVGLVWGKVLSNQPIRRAWQHP